jgi:hypothetical protein
MRAAVGAKGAPQSKRVDDRLYELAAHLTERDRYGAEPNH